MRPEPAGERSGALEVVFAAKVCELGAEEVALGLEVADVFAQGGDEEVHFGDPRERLLADGGDVGAEGFAEAGVGHGCCSGSWGAPGAPIRVEPRSGR